MRGWVLVMVSACYAPHPRAGAPCPTGDCPAPLVCSPATETCELAGEPAVDGPRADGCTPAPELCGDGIDQDCDFADPPCPDNDAATGAIDVGAGGTFTANVAFAHDDVGGNCGGTGGRDVFYKVTLQAPRVFYFDTFDSDFDSTIRVFAKSCNDLGNVDELACADDACGGGQSQLAVALPAGQSCIVVDQASADETRGNVRLTVIRGERDGAPLAPMVSGNNCNSENTTEPLDQDCDAPGSDGKDDAYFFTTCPNETLSLDADTCGLATWDTVLYVRRNEAEQIGCNDDACGDLQSRLTNVTISGGPLYFLIVDAFDPTFCGEYEVRTTLAP